MTHRGFLPTFMLLLAGMLAWAAHFAVVYGAAALICAGRIENRDVAGYPLTVAVTAIATVAAAVFILAAVLVGRRRWKAPHGVDRPQDGFLSGMTLLIGGLGFAAIVLTGLAGVLTPVCGPSVN